jgi:uncharacterized protein YjbI with pentapeptide repeats
MQVIQRLMSRASVIRLPGRVATVVATVVVVVFVLWLALLLLPDIIARQDVGAAAGSQGALRLQEARETVRTQLLTSGAGIFAAAALVYTARNYTLSRTGQVTDRYARAIEQLGSEKIDVRIGGIYALERVALDSRRDHPIVMEVLAAFIREHSHEQWSSHEPGPDLQERLHLLGAEYIERIRRSLIVRHQDRDESRLTRPDIQAALTVIGRRNSKNDTRSVALFGADLRNADLRNAVLRRANLNHADLSGSDLSNADLTTADLYGANLKGAILREAKMIKAKLFEAILVDSTLINADLTHAALKDADLSKANLWTTVLQNAYLGGANLSGADLRGAKLTRAWLIDVDLSGAAIEYVDFTGADLTGVKFSPGASVPEGWVQDPESGRLKQAENMSAISRSLIDWIRELD